MTGLPGTAAAVLFWLAVWYILSEVISLELLVPSPAATVRALKELCVQKDFYVSCGKTLLRVLCGWGAGLAAGTVLALLTSVSRIAAAFLSPLLHIIRATPVASFIVLALVLMKNARVPVFTGALIAVPVVWGNISEGFASPDKKLLEMAHAFNMKKRTVFREIRLPAVLPYFAAAATTSMGLVWKACVAAEVICAPSDSIGSGIQNAKVYLETPSLFAWTLTVIVLSMLLEKAVGLILRKKTKRS